MFSPQQESESGGALTREHWEVPIRVRLVPYVEFSRWLDAQLETLVRRWSNDKSGRRAVPRP